MILNAIEDVYRRLITARTRDEVQEILQLVGDHPALELDEKFGPLGLQWHPFGDNPSNISTIGLATKPGRSLTERITNGMDALLEERAIPGVTLPPSPRIAAQQWFGRNATGPDDGLFKSVSSGLDRHIAVVIESGEEEAAANVDVVDDGIGIRPHDFPKTILSLQAGNKITRRYLIGAFGQGGASTLAFSDYVLISSRHHDSVGVVGFTLIKVLRLDATYKEDSYAYLAISDESGGVAVPSFQCDHVIDLYPDYADARKPMHGKGTFVRHYSFTLSKLDKTLAPSPGNLYHFLHVSLFDPLFPFRLLDLRQRGKEKDELVSGSRNRLLKLVQQASPSVSEEESGSEIAHYRPMEYVVPFGCEEPTIGIEYWVVLNYRKQQGRSVLRGTSNDLYVQPNHPIIATMNGQNQGELTAQLLRDIGLGMVSRHMVIHIDATRVNSTVRRELFATSREGLKDGDVLDHLVRVLTNMLREDQQLFVVERDLTERVAKKETEATNEEVKRQVAKLLIEAGFDVMKQGPAAAPGASGEKQIVRERRRGKPVGFEPLPTQPFPTVTKFDIVVPKPKMEVRINDNEVVLVETDADAEFDKRGLLAIRTEPPTLELAAHSPLRGGRVRWRLRPTSNAKVGDTGKIIATITKLDGTQLSDSTEFEVFPALEEKTKKTKTQVPPFEIIPINPDDNPDQWALAWPDHGFQESADELRRVAYKPIKQGGGIFVYYSTIFPPYAQQIESLKQESQALLQLFRTEYEIWIGYHAILQENSTPVQGDEAVLDKVLEQERVRVAQLQVKQAMQSAKLRDRHIKELASAP